MLGGNTPSTFLSTYLPVYPAIAMSLLNMTNQCLVYSTYLTNWDKNCVSKWWCLFWGVILHILPFCMCLCVCMSPACVNMWVTYMGQHVPMILQARGQHPVLFLEGQSSYFFKPWSLTGILTCRLGKAGWPASHSFELTILILGL